jgi:hypothetical protein
MVRAGCAATTCAPPPSLLRLEPLPMAASSQRHPDSSLIYPESLPATGSKGLFHSAPPLSNRQWPNIKNRPNSLTTDEKTFSNR